MNPGSPAVEAQRLYAFSNWTGRLEDRDKLKRRWLDAQLKELPDGYPGREYRRTISRIKTPADSGVHHMESELLERRYEFKADIGGQSFGYRELLAALRNGEGTPGIRYALLEETDNLIEGGFTELVRYRNQKARESGYTDYWSRKNAAYGKGLVRFLTGLDSELWDSAAVDGTSQPALSSGTDLETAVIFFCSLIFPGDGIPPAELLVRFGEQCPPGPPTVHPLSYRPKKGHLLGLDIPFVHENRIDSGSIGAFFHELVHLFHFASIDDRGGYAFASELARDNLLYEVEAVGFQNLVSSAWVGRLYSLDKIMLKDLVYLAETERQLYGLDSPSRSHVRDFVRSRIDEHYPDGDFMRTPLGASHLIIENSAARYWMYPAAQWLGDRRIRRSTMPDCWLQGNDASYEMNTEKLFEVGNGTLLTDTAADFRISLSRSAGLNRDAELKDELETKGYGELLG